MRSLYFDRVFLISIVLSIRVYFRVVVCIGGRALRKQRSICVHSTRHTALYSCKLDGLVRLRRFRVIPRGTAAEDVVRAGVLQ